MYVEGRVLTTEGEPIADAVIETWEADHNGMPAIARHPYISDRALTRRQGSMTHSMPTEPTQTVVGACVPPKMAALGTVPLFRTLTQSRVT